ncbi:unnamed protein product, partial [Iphiclides podalirius]
MSAAAGLARRTPVHGQGSPTAPGLRRNPTTELRLVASSFVLISHIYSYIMLHDKMHFPRARKNHGGHVTGYISRAGGGGGLRKPGGVRRGGGSMRGRSPACNAPPGRSAAPAAYAALVPTCLRATRLTRPEELHRQTDRRALLYTLLYSVEHQLSVKFFLRFSSNV